VAAEAVLLVLSPSVWAEERADCSLAKSALKIASEIRGLKPKRSVVCKVQSKADVERYLKNVIDEKFPVSLLKNEARVYKHLGLIPRDYDYVDGLLKLYLGELGGYYDAEKEYYAVADWMPLMVQMPIAVHELTHALQDQHFGLDTLVDPRIKSSDQALASSALAEGDATAVMFDFSRIPIGQPPLAEEESIADSMMQIVFGSVFSPSAQHSPQALRALLMFPYVSGLHFAHRLLRKGGYTEVNKAFLRMPQTTEEILHPEIYLRSQKSFSVIDTPAAPKGLSLAKAEPVFVDTLGEFFIATWLGQTIGPAAASLAAAGWGGDRIALYELKDSTEGLLVWHLRWDSKKDADEFVGKVLASYKKQYGAFRLSELVPEARADGLAQARLEQKGVDTFFIAGIPRRG
jgi:hypothetical protein